MRKYIAILLAVLMALGAIPALAESVLPWEGDEVEINFYMAYTANDDTKPIFQELMKHFGNVKFNFEVTSTEDRETKRNLYLASGEIPDIMVCQGLKSIKTNYFPDGEDIFLNFKQYEDIMPNWKANREADPSQLQFDVDENTAYFSLPVVANYASEGWMVNKTRLDEYGLEIPTTFEEMEEVMATIEAANPETTQLAGYTCWGVDYWRHLTGNLIGNAGRDAAGYYRDEDTGKYYLYAYDPVFKETVELLADWYAKGYFHPDDFNMSEEEMISKVWANHDWTFACTYQNSPEQFTNKWNNDLEIDVQVMLPPAKEGVTPVIEAAYRNDLYYWALCASAQTKNPEVVCAIVDFLAGDEYSTLYYWGVEGETFEEVDGVRQYIGEYTDPAARIEYGIQKTIPEDIASRRDADAMAAANPDRLVEAWAKTSKWLNSGEATMYYYTEPDFTQDEAEEFARIYTPISTYINENLSLFVYGQRDLAEWDAFIDGIKDYGDVDKLLELCDNAAQKTYLSAEERDYWVPAKYR